MHKIRYDVLSLNTFKVVEKKKKNTQSNNKRLTKLIRGLCIKEDDDYKISVNVKELKPNIIDNNKPDVLVIPFTEESYNLKGVISVFSRTPDKNNKYIRYIRSETQCKFFPGNKEKLVPFCKNWVCTGYIVKRNNQLQFEFHECITPNGYDVMIKPIDE